MLISPRYFKDRGVEMKKLGLAILAMVGLCLTASIAAADVRTLAQVGAWEAFGGTTSNGRQMCGLSTAGSGKFFSIKYFYGDDTFTIQMGSDGWNIANGAKQKLTMRFDGNPPWGATATGFHFSTRQAGLEVTVSNKQLSAFMTEFRASNELRMNFEGSNVNGWWVSLAGTNAVSQVFGRCIVVITR